MSIGTGVADGPATSDPSSDDGDADLVQRRSEIIVAALVGLAAAFVLDGFLTAIAFDRVIRDGGHAIPAWELVEMASLGSSGGLAVPGGRLGVVPVAIALAYALVVLVPSGPVVTRIGVAVLAATRALGALFGVGIVLGLGAVLRRGDRLLPAPRRRARRSGRARRRRSSVGSAWLCLSSAAPSSWATSPG